MLVFISSCRFKLEKWIREAEICRQGYPGLLGVVLCDEYLMMLTVLEALAAPSGSHSHKQQQHIHLV